MLWLQIHPLATPDHLGYIPTFMDAADERPAAEQINEHYCAGWHPTQPASSFTLPVGASLHAPGGLRLKFPGDPPLEPLWAAKLRDELVVVYEYGYTAIFQPDMTFAIDRLD